jgi:hypothetical protein
MFMAQENSTDHHDHNIRSSMFWKSRTAPQRAHSARLVGPFGDSMIQ